jgi:outer membrane protein TolC
MRIILTLLVGFTAATADVPPITLGQALETALEQSLSVEEAGIKRAQGKQSLGEGVSYLFPELSASLSKSADSIGELGENSWSFRLTLSQPVVDANVIFGLVGGIRQNNVYKAEYEQMIAELILEVQNAYYDLAETQALVSSAERQYERAAENLKVVERQYELGDATKADKLRAEVNLLSAEKEVISARAGLNVNRLAFADVIGLDSWDSITVEELPAPEEPDLLPTTIVSSTLLKGNPELETLEAQVKASDTAYWGAWGSLLPSLSFYVNKYYNRAETSFPDSGSATYGLTVSFPIFDVPNRILDINGARLDRKQSRIELARKELDARERLVTLLETQDSTYKEWEFTSKNVELSSEVYRLTSRSYELGASTYANLLDVDAELTLAERELVRAKSEYWSNRAELNYVLVTSVERK